MNLIFLGPPGVGKGTCAESVSKKYNIPKISTGDLLRDEVKRGSELGLRAKSYMDKGELVPDDLVIEILKKWLEQKDCKKGFILDGFPRSMGQLKILEKITSIDLVLNFTLPEEEIIKRMTGRLTCKKCRAVYHETDIRPKSPGICDLCGGRLYKREDQKPGAVKNRLRVYSKQTEPVTNFYRRKHMVKDIDARGTPEDVLKRVVKVLEEVG